MTDKKPLTPKSQWHELSVYQLYDLKSDLVDTYYNMARVGATNAKDFLRFSEQVDVLISQKQAALEAEKERDQD